MTHQKLFAYTALIVLASATILSRQAAAHRASRKGWRADRPSSEGDQQTHPVQPALKSGVDASLTSQTLPF